MAKKFKPTNAVKGTAAEYARRVVTNNKKQKKLLKDTSQLPVLRQLGIDAAEQDTSAANRALLSSAQFAFKAGATMPQIARAYYSGAVKGVVKGVLDNFRNK